MEKKRKLRWQFVVMLWDFMHCTCWYGDVGSNKSVIRSESIWFTWLWICAQIDSEGKWNPKSGKIQWEIKIVATLRNMHTTPRTRFLDIHYSDKSNCQDCKTLRHFPSLSVCACLLVSKYVSLISISTSTGTKKCKSQKRVNFYNFLETMPAKAHAPACISTVSLLFLVFLCWEQF